MKVCTKCGETKALDEFSKHAIRRDGLRGECKACGTALATAYRLNNKEKVKAARAEFRVANRERLNAINAARYADNPVKAKARMSAYYAANKDEFSARAAKWRAENPEARRINHQNRRALKQKAGGKLSKGLANKLFNLQRGKCACGCRQPLGDNYHLDHIVPLALGGANEDYNMQLLMATCNLQKHAKHPVFFMQERGFLL